MHTAHLDMSSADQKLKIVSELSGGGLDKVIPATFHFPSISPQTEMVTSVELTNNFSYPLKWFVSAFAPPYLKVRHNSHKETTTIYGAFQVYFKNFLRRNIVLIS